VTYEFKHGNAHHVFGDNDGSRYGKIGDVSITFEILERRGPPSEGPGARGRDRVGSLGDERATKKKEEG